MPASADERPPSGLFRSWWRSVGEDSGETQAYRPSGFPLPPARGRIGYTFERDGSAAYLGIAPGDGSARAPGRWEWRPTARLTIRFEGGDDLEFEVVTCEQDLLR